MRRNGFTLVELIIVIVIMGIMFMIAMPKMHDWSISADARGARTSAVAILARARAAAVQRNVVVNAQFDGTNGAVVVAGTTDTINRVALGAEYGVTMSPSSWSVGYDPRGLGMNGSTTTTVTFTRAGKTATLTVQPYGRVSQ
jgi:prepilin-type N-terminal cleavage/methylation domain-containing protein